MTKRHKGRLAQLENSSGRDFAEEFLKPMAISAYASAKRRFTCRRPASMTSFWNGAASPRIRHFVLSRVFFGTTEQFWLNLQDAYDIGRVKGQSLCGSWNRSNR